MTLSSYTESNPAEAPKKEKLSFKQRNIKGAKRAFALGRFATTLWMGAYLGSGILSSFSDGSSFALQDLKPAPPEVRKMLQLPFSPEVSTAIEKYNSSSDYLDTKTQQEMNLLLKRDILQLAELAKYESPTMAKWLASMVARDLIVIDPNLDMGGKTAHFKPHHDTLSMHWIMSNLTREQVLILFAHERNHFYESPIEQFHIQSSPQCVWGDLCLRVGPVLGDIFEYAGKQVPRHSDEYNQKLKTILDEWARDPAEAKGENDGPYLFMSEPYRKRFDAINEHDKDFFPGKVSTLLLELSENFHQMGSRRSGMGYSNAYGSNPLEKKAVEEERRMSFAINGTRRTVNELIDNTTEPPLPPSWPAQPYIAALILGSSLLGYGMKMRNSRKRSDGPAELLSTLPEKSHSDLL